MIGDFTLTTSTLPTAAVMLTGSKSFTESYGSFNRLGFTEKRSDTSTIVWPSGTPFATRSVPMISDAPGRLSTSTCWFQLSVSFWPRMRAMPSLLPPGATGTIKRIGRLG